MKRCKHCGRLIVKAPRGPIPKFCTGKCRVAAHRAGHRASRPTKAEVKHKIKASIQGWSILLSECHVAEMNLHNVKHDVCVVCSTPLTPRQQRYCKPLCASRAFHATRTSDGRLKEQRIKHADKRKQWEVNAKEPRECIVCGRTWMVYRYAVSQHCSTACKPKPPKDTRRQIAERRLAKAMRGKQITKRIFVMGRCHSCGLNTMSVIQRDMATTWAIYCSKACSHRAHHDKRRALTMGAKITKGQRYQVFERDNWICQICGDPVNRLPASPTAPDAACVDHRLPLARGGSHGLSNWQTAHQYCNSVKGANVDFSLIDAVA